MNTDHPLRQALIAGVAAFLFSSATIYATVASADPLPAAAGDTSTMEINSPTSIA